MRSVSTLFAATVLLIATGVPAFSQGGGFGYGGGFGTAGAIGAISNSASAGQNCAGYGSGSNGSGDQTVYTFHFGSCFAMPVVTDAPYSGHNTTQSERTLQDGTHLTQPLMNQPMIYRDALGRTRTERSPLGPIGMERQQPAGAPARPAEPVVAEINDPVAGYHYVLDPVNHVAHRVKVLSQNTLTSAAAPGPSSHTLPNGANITSEPLGTQTMFGVTVTGTRNTTTYPPGTYQNNDRQVTSVSEMWRSPQYGLVLLSKTSGVNGDSTMSIQDFNPASPDPALFQVPAGYQIVDEANEFTFTIHRVTQ